ncbi:hypothetical protein PRZ48_009436 [Zasmidium cellare]|uniref:N-acetyltransferase domain-containing protein n=1 Tax=Zasmidium cellare TaxID=395010 RepID=A0ABR0ECD8_ZASCE|nr:hypothetical protein PRZ48_009436 [Zasmidium cellare]
MATAQKDPITITKVLTPTDLQSTTTLFKAYAHSLGIDLTFQDFATEMAQMPGKYAPPHGTLLLAKDTNSKPIGCAGLRRFPSKPGHCEMKRLYVHPDGRGLGVGRKLAEAVVKEAKGLGYEAVLLDTLASMESAQKLYRSLGFVEVEAYYESPIAKTTFLRLDLKT